MSPQVINILLAIGAATIAAAVGLLLRVWGQVRAAESEEQRPAPIAIHQPHDRRFCQRRRSLIRGD